MKFQNFYRTLQLIHASLFIGLLLFTTMTYFHIVGFQFDQDSADMSIYTIPIFAAGLYFASTYIFQNQLKGISSLPSLKRKTQKYTVALIVKYALIETAAFIALFAYFVNANVLHLVITLTLLVYLLAQRPTKQKLIRELALSHKERKEFHVL